MIIQKPVPAFTPGRAFTPDVIVIHVGEGSQQAIYNTFLTEDKSSHYCVSKAGEVWQFVDEKDTAWAQGLVVRPTSEIVKSRKGNPNGYCISIENEGFGSKDFTVLQYVALASLVKDICARWGIPIDREHVIGHREIRADKTCPGIASVDKVVALAKGSASNADRIRALIKEIEKLL